MGGEGEEEGAGFYYGSAGGEEVVTWVVGGGWAGLNDLSTAATVGDTEQAAVRAVRASRERRLVMLRCVFSAMVDIVFVGGVFWGIDAHRLS